MIFWPYVVGIALACLALGLILANEFRVGRLLRRGIDVDLTPDPDDWFAERTPR